MNKSLYPAASWVGGVALAASLVCLMPGTAMALDFLQSYQAALSEDALFRAAQAQARANSEVVPLARAQLYPNITSSLGMFGNGRSASGEPSDRYPSSNFALTLRQPLYRPAQVTGYRQSQVQLEDVQATLDKAQQEAAVRVSQAYFNVLSVKESLAVVRAQRAAMSSQLDAAKKALIAGAGARTDIDDAQARLDVNRAQEISVRQQIDRSLHELSVLVDRPVSSVHVLHPERLQLKPMQPDALGPWLERAQAASPELKSLQARVEVARMEVERIKAGKRPTVDLVLQHSRNASDNVFNPDARYRNNQIGVQAQWSLYSGGSVDAQVRSAQASLTENEELLDAARRQLTTDVRKQFQAVQEGVGMVRALEQAERSADQMVLSSEKGFKAGTRTRLDILNAEQQRSQTRLELARERINFVVARLQLLALSGGLSLDEVRTINSWLVVEPVVEVIESSAAVETHALASNADVAEAIKPTQTTAAAPSRPASAASIQMQNVTLAVNNWVAAWMRKDMAAYLDAYAPDFKLPKKQTRADWAQYRKAQITGKTQPIQIELSDVKISVTPLKATAQFRQAYRSGTLSDNSNKTLVLVPQGDRWLIQEETVR